MKTILSSVTCNFEIEGKTYSLKSGNKIEVNDKHEDAVLKEIERREALNFKKAIPKKDESTSITMEMDKLKNAISEIKDKVKR